MDIAKLVCPPGGASEIGLAALAQSLPYHSLHLFPSIATRQSGSGLDEAEENRLRTTAQGWLERGILVREKEPSIYVHHLTFPTEDGTLLTRKGFFALLRLGDGGGLRVLPHEETISARVSRQLRILTATDLQLLPIFLLYSDPADTIQQYLASDGTSELLASFTDGLGQEHRLERLSRQESVSWLERAFDGREVVIADGHHRFESLRALWHGRTEQRGKAEGAKGGDHGGEGYAAVYLSAVDAPGFQIGAFCRIVCNLLISYRNILGLLEPVFHRTRVKIDSRAPWLAIRRELEAQQGTAFGIYGHGEKGWDMLKPREGFLSRLGGEIEGASPPLDVNILHQEILKRLGTEEGDQPEVAFEKRADKAFERVTRGEGRLACFVKPLRPDQIWSVARQGLTLPAKATYFSPKIPAGLVAMSLSHPGVS